MPRTALLILAVFLLVAAQPLPAQTGAIELVVRITPSSGRPEPVRGLTVHLLGKSYSDIQKEAEAEHPPTNLEGFVEKLEITAELKSWMKRNATVRLSGEEFIRKVTSRDVLEVPELYRAYLARNAGDEVVGFPRPKYRERDRQRNPARFERQVREYHEALRKFLEANPHTLQGLDIHLTDVDPGHRWLQQESERQRRVRELTAALAHSRYRVAQAETDLEGRAGLTGLPPGEYWLSTLEREAIVGDVRLRWDVAVTVEAGRTTRVELANYNGTRP